MSVSNTSTANFGGQNQTVNIGTVNNIKGPIIVIVQQVKTEEGQSSNGTFHNHIVPVALGVGFGAFLSSTSCGSFDTWVVRFVEEILTKPEVSNFVSHYIPVVNKLYMLYHHLRC